jgi:hypothetical protein
MKTRIHGFLVAVVVASAILIMPLTARAHDWGRWHHDNGNHLGWYKHHGGYGNGAYGAPGYAYGGNPGGWRGHHHHHDWDDDDRGYGGPANGGYSNAYGGYGGYGYSGSPMIAAPTLGTYQPNYGAYAPTGNLGNMGKLMRRQQLATQRLSANQALYQAAMSQGNYALANKAAAHIQKQSGILNGANSMLGGVTPYSNYGVPAYGATPYYGQSAYGPGAYGQSAYGPAASPLSSILQMLP